MLHVPFEPLFLRQKITNQNVTREKAAQSTFVWKICK
jgi:hypothetical protein